jgi:hypothetical protein
LKGFLCKDTSAYRRKAPSIAVEAVFGGVRSTKPLLGARSIAQPSSEAYDLAFDGASLRRITA